MIVQSIYIELSCSYRFCSITLHPVYYFNSTRTPMDSGYHHEPIRSLPVNGRSSYSVLCIPIIHGYPPKWRSSTAELRLMRSTL